MRNKINKSLRAFLFILRIFNYNPPSALLVCDANDMQDNHCDGQRCQRSEEHYDQVDCTEQTRLPTERQSDRQQARE